MALLTNTNFSTLMKQTENFIYFRGGFKTAYDYLKAYTEAVEEILVLQNTHGYNAAVFTQIADVEAELNGYFSYDRKVNKVDISQLHALNLKLFSANIE